jgi:NodT family efflux transporter outer membrane factor (OMF) lipoprotein
MKRISLSLIAVALIGLSSHGDTPSANGYLQSTLPDRWQYEPAMIQQLPADDSWWRSLNDPVLDSLISIGVDNNFDLRIALQRIVTAKATVAQARSQLYPTIALNLSWDKARTSGRLTRTAVAAGYDSYFDVGVSMNWELDIFGKVASSVKSKNELYHAQRADYAAAMISLCGQIATNYVQLRQWQHELQLAQEQSQSQQEIVDMTILRHNAGLASALDVAQAKEVLYSTQATMPPLRNSISTAVNAIAFLLGAYPSQLSSMLCEIAPLPDYRQIVASGIPAQLLRRRPDVVAAERQLASYAADLGVAKKDFLPSLSITGSIGTQSRDAGNLFSKESLTYSVAPTLSWTLFDGFGRKAQLASARSAVESGIANYNMVVMKAVQETDNALSAYHAALQHIDALQNVVEQSNKALALSVDLYRQGLSTFTNVVDAQINVLSYSNELITAKADALTALIQLYEALGGGWNESNL